MKRENTIGQLGQVRPTDTNNTVLYAPSFAKTWKADTLVVCNTSGALATARVFHDKDGTTYDETTALLWDMPVEAGETVIISDFRIAGQSKDGKVACRSDTGSALTFTLYGEEVAG